MKKYCKTIKEYLICTFSTVLIILLLFAFAIKFSTRNWGKGFNNVWLDNSHWDINAKCKFIDWTFPNYDLGIYLMLPMHLMFRKECDEKELKK